MTFARAAIAGMLNPAARYGRVDFLAGPGLGAKRPRHGADVPADRTAAGCGNGQHAAGHEN